MMDSAVHSWLQFYEGNPMLGGLALASIELALLTLLLVVAIRTKVLRTPRLRSLFWIAVMVKPMAVLLLGNSLPLFEVAPVEEVRDTVATATVIEPAPSPTQSAEQPPTTTSQRPAPRQAQSPSTPAVSIPWQMWVLGVYVSGMALMVLRILVDEITLLRWRRNSVSAEDSTLQIFKEQINRLELRRSPAFFITGDIESPALAGFIKPAIYLPRWMNDENNRTHTAWAINHELTHWKHGDVIANFLRRATQTVFWFNPFAWWAGAEWERDAELACDRALVSSKEECSTYASELYDLLEVVHARKDNMMLSGLCATRTQVGQRIAALLQNPLQWPARLGARRIAVFAACAIAMMFVGLRFDLQEVEAQADAETEPADEPFVTPPAPGERVLSFPGTHSMGEIQIRDWGVNYGAGWTTLSQAQGEVVVPAGMEVRLDLSAQGSADMSPLADLDADALQSIRLYRDPVTNEQMSYLSHTTGLRQITLSYTSITSEGLAHLQNNRGLESLNLHTTNVGDEGLSYLQDMTEMRRLILNRTGIGDEGMSYLTNMGKLEILDNWLGTVSDEGMKHIGELTSLKELGLENNRFTDEGLKHLKDLDNLQLANFESNRITDEAIDALLELEDLSSASFHNTLMSADAILALLQNGSLRGVSLPITVSKEEFEMLERAGMQTRSHKREENAERSITVLNDSTNQPIAGARVSFMFEGDRTVYMVYSGTRGTVSLWPPRYSPSVPMFVEAEGYVPQRVTWNIADETNLLVRLSSGTWVGGVVVDEDGNPIPDVTVNMPQLGAQDWVAAASGRFDVAKQTVITSEDGYWENDTFPSNPNDFEITLSHPEFQTTTLDKSNLSLAELQTGNVQMVMLKGAWLTGRTLDSEGRPITGARVYFMTNTNPPRVDREVFSDSQGKFALPNMDAGKMVEIIAEAAGYFTLRQEVRIDGREAIMTLPELEPVEFAVKNADGEPMPDVALIARSQGLGDFGWRGTTNDEGLATWEEAPPTTLSIQADWASRYVLGWDTVLHPFDEPVEIVAYEKPEITIRATHHDTGEPAAGATLYVLVGMDIELREREYMIDEVTLNEEGVFVLSPEGGYSLRPELFEDGDIDGMYFTVKMRKDVALVDVSDPIRYGESKIEFEAVLPDFESAE